MLYTYNPIQGVIRTVPRDAWLRGSSVVTVAIRNLDESDSI